MYRSDLGHKDRGAAIAAAVGINAALLFAFLQISGRVDLTDSQSALRMIDLSEAIPPPPLPPPPPPEQRNQRRKPKQTEGGSPANIRSQATPVVAPEPIVEPQRPNPINVSQTPNQGAAPTQGAAAVPGPGTGTGGTGTGTGNGSGPGGGGDDGGVAYPPRMISPDLRGRDFGRDLLEQWPRGANIFLRLKIDNRGFISECVVDRGTGIPAIDLNMCNLAYQRLRFRPATNRAGRPIAGWVGYRQMPPR
jgi:protein TonB